MAAISERKPSSATAARMASLFAKCLYGAACETPAKRAAARSVNAAVPCVSTMCSAASSSARGKSPWWYPVARPGRRDPRLLGRSCRSRCRTVAPRVAFGVDTVNISMLTVFSWKPRPGSDSQPGTPRLRVEAESGLLGRRADGELHPVRMGARELRGEEERRSRHEDRQEP